MSMTKQDMKKKIRIQHMYNREDKICFGKWMARKGRIISETKGDKEKIKQIINNAIEKKELQISNNYYDHLMQLINESPNNVKTLYVLYNSMLKAQGNGVLKL